MHYSLDQPCAREEEIKKSRFLTRAFPLSKIDDFASILDRIRADASATHHCFAWKYGIHYRFFDDGEPTGTAGRPILAAIEGRNCDQIAVIVSRWYGGIKLGTGGLARAYGGGAARLLGEAKLVEIVAMSHCQLVVPFALWARLENALPQFSIRVETQEFNDAGVHLALTLPQKKADDWAGFVRDLSRGQVVVSIK